MIGERWIERLVHSWLEANHRVLDSCPFCGGVRFGFFASDGGEDLITDITVLEEFSGSAVNDDCISKLIEAVPIEYLETVERGWCDCFILHCDCGARMRGDSIDDLIISWNRRIANGNVQ